MILINADRQVDMVDIEREHLQYFKTIIGRKLDTIISIKQSRNKSFYRYLKAKLEDILVGNPQVLNDIVKEIKGVYGLSFENKLIRKTSLYKKLTKVFNYRDFVSSYPPASWGAYQLVSKLRINVCPYCNRQYTLTVINNDPAVTGKTRARLDHFYDKATYPYLAVSLYNLIPCCSICNSDLKGSIDFTVETHLHPYIEEFGDFFRFGVEMLDKSALSPGDQKQIDYLFGMGEEFEIVIRDACKDPVLRRKVLNNLEVFKIKELYNQHKDYVVDLIKKRVIYSDSLIDELYNQYNGLLFSSREDVIQMITSNYIGTDNLDKRVLAKMTRDISEELGLFIV